MRAEELLTLRFVAEGANVVLLGPNGVGKTMLPRASATRPCAARPSRAGKEIEAAFSPECGISAGLRWSRGGGAMRVPALVRAVRTS